MFRSRAPRSAVAAALSIVLIAAFMVGTTSAAATRQASDRAAPAAPKPKPSPTPTPTPIPTPTPTPTSDNRTVYFGDDPKSDNGDGVIVPTTVTAGNTFRFDLFIENEGSQRLTHAQVGYGSLAVARSGANPSLPAGASIASATLNGVGCALTDDFLGALCDLGQFDAGETATAEFIVNAPSVAVITTTYASLKVAENVPDQGANRNTFYADATLNVGPTNSDSNATYKTGGSFSLSTDGNTLVKKDTMTTTVTGTAGGVGAISISEEDCAPNQCPGQIATVHVQGGAIQTPYLEWKLVIIGTFDGSITHELDDPALPPVEISRSCDANIVNDVDCISFSGKTGNVSTVVFRTATNGRVHG